MARASDEGLDVRLLRIALDGAQEAVNVLDLSTGQYVYMNAAQRTLTGFSEEELGGMTAREALERVHPEDREISAGQQRRLAESGDSTVVTEYRWRVRSGEYRWFRDTRRVVRDGQGRPVALVGTSVDLTEQKRLEEEAQRAHAELRHHLSNTPLAVVEWDGDFRVTRFSGRAEEMFGWTEAEVLGRRIDEVPWIPEEDWPSVRAVMADMASAARPVNVNANRNRRRDGGVIHCEWYNSTLHDAAGRLRSVFSLVRDVTERELVQERLVASRLAAMGTLVAGLAHELNNPLAVVTSGIEYADETLRRVRAGASPGGGEAPQALDDVVASLADARVGAQRMARVVREFTTFGRPDGRRIPVGLASVARDALRWLPGSVLRGASLRVVVDEDPEVKASAPLLGQVVTSLVTNAAAAVPPGRPGTITVRVAAGRPGTACLEVVDDGVGMTPEVMRRIFDPFFTTHETGQGLGLGLPICHAIVTAHGGTITAASRPGEGSTFRVELPLVAGD